MTSSFNIEHRRPIWIALSDLYLDTELQESHFQHIALTILHSPYSLEEVKAINQHEVFPVLIANLLSVAGIWEFFDEDQLVDLITTNLRNNNLVQDALRYQSHKSMIAGDWEKLEKVYADIKANGLE